MNINAHSLPTAAVSSCGSSASAAPCSAHHCFTAQSAHPGQQRAPRTARSSRVRLDGMGQKGCAGCWPGAGLVLAGHYYSQSYFMAAVNWPCSARRTHAGRRMGPLRQSQLQLRHVLQSTKFQTSWLMLKCWKQCSQCSSLHSDRV